MQNCDIASDLLPLRPSEAGRRALRIWLPIAIAAIGFAALPLDLPIARWIEAGGVSRETGRLLNLAEIYAYGFGVGAILLTALVLDWRRRALFPRAVTTVVAAGFFADLLKMSISRSRPHAFSLAGNVWSTFGHWLPVNHVASDFKSFPSGHMAEAAALTAVLIWLYPRGRWLFITFALLAGAQRIYATAHFLSDVTWGAAVGAFSASLFLPGGWRAATFDRIENFLNRRWNEERGAGAAITPHGSPSAEHALRQRAA
jgi:membrane-associated phospholipid phosphatase